MSDTKKQRRKEKRIKKIIEARKTIRFLMSSRNFTLDEAKLITRTVPLVASMNRPPIPVRMTEMTYPLKFISSTEDKRFKTVQSFISDEVRHRDASPIVSFVVISGYILVLTTHRGCEQIVRNLMAQLWNQGIQLREPTKEQVGQFLEKRHTSGLPRPKPSQRCTREAKHWREFLTGQRVQDSETEDSDDDDGED